MKNPVVGFVFCMLSICIGLWFVQTAFSPGVGGFVTEAGMPADPLLIAAFGLTFLATGVCGALSFVAKSTNAPQWVNSFQEKLLPVVLISFILTFICFFLSDCRTHAPNYEMKTTDEGVSFNFSLGGNNKH